MSRYAIYACDQIFGGLHGMCTHTVIDADSMREAEEYALQESLDIISSYSAIYEAIESDVNEAFEENPNLTEDELSELYDELCNEDTEWSVYKIDERTAAANHTTQELDSWFYNDPEEFMSQFCIIK